MFTLFAGFCIVKGSLITILIVVCASNKAIISASSSTSSLKLSEIKACSGVSDDWSFSCALATTPWI